jgi:glucose-6-phosphate isomerase
VSRLVSHSSDRLGRLHADAERIVGDPAVAEATRSIRERRGLGHDMLGWLDLPARRDDLPRLLDTTARLREEIDTLVVVGIGGSYLGARAVLEATAWSRADDPGPRVFFAGHHLEAHELGALLRALEGREVAVNVISKSGTTTEPAIAFRLLRKQLEDTYGPEKAARRIVATTDAERGALRTLAQQKDYATFAVPDDVGGRFSVLSPVGLVPLAVAGCDVEALLDGARDEFARCLEGEPADVPAVRYAALRHAAYLQGSAIEVLASFFPSLHQVAEWWKQLFGESEGKQGRGLFPAAVDYTTDLHSMGQYLQDGRRLLLETFLDVAEPPKGPAIPSDRDDLDGLEYLAGRDVAAVNREALPAVADAHASGGVPCQVVTLPDLGEGSLGSLLAFFEFAVAVSGRLLGVHPFDQPGVEAYKTNLFRRLGKPGFTD